MKKIIILLLFVMALSGTWQDIHAQSLVVSGSLFLPGEKISFTYESPAFNASDWIGIFHKGETPGDVNPVNWDYIPAASGILELDAPEESGKYVAFLVCCEENNILDTSDEFTVEEPFLGTDYHMVLENRAITFSYKSPKFSDKDRIAIYSAGVEPGGANPPIAEQYITSVTGILEFPDGLSKGYYDVYLFCCDSYDIITGCSIEVVQATTAFINPRHLMFEPGAALYFSYNDPVFADGDWIGIYDEFDNPASVPAVTWGQLISGSGIVSFPGVIPGGSYIAILFCCGGTETEIVRSEVFEVDYSFTETYIRTASSVYPEYSTILVNYREEDFSDKDWIGIYPKGILPGEGQEPLGRYYALSDSGTMKFEILLAKGEYTVYLLCCDGYKIKAKYDFRIVDQGDPYIVSARISYANGEDLEFEYNSPGYVPTDWVGIYHAGEIPGSSGVYSITWKYLPDANGTMKYSYPEDYGENQLPEPLPPGDYYAGLFCCDAYGLYAMTAFTVDVRGVGIGPSPEYSERLSLWPNPSTGKLTVKVQDDDMMRCITVFTITGQVLYREYISGPVHEKRLDLEPGKGVFLVEVITDRSVLSKGLIIR